MDSLLPVIYATNMRVVSFAQDLIYDVTRCKVQTPECIGLAVLLKNLTGSAELVKVRQTLVFKNLKSNNQYFFPQTMISRFNLLPHRHFHYLSLIESLFDS
jgi:hypothetical protein